MNLTFNPEFNVYQTNFTANTATNNLTVGKLKELLAQGYTPARISELTGMKLRTIYSRIENFKLETPTQAKRKRLNTALSAMRVETTKITDIMKETGAKASYVEKWIKQHFDQTPAQKKREKLIELLKTGMPDNEIAEKMNISIHGVQAARKRHKIRRTDIKKQNRIEYIHNALLNDLSYDEIAQKLNISKSTVKIYAKEIKKTLDIKA